MTNNTLLGLSIASALGLSFTPTAFAADNAPAKTVERIEVIGSHIKRTDVEGANPVLNISRDDIDKSGYTNLQQLLEKMPATGNGTFSTRGNNQDSTANGAAAVSLRGLGADATLVLVNGRRMAINSFAQNISTSFVDINAIPVSAIERIEVLKDGASALYGADAVAGVVNIVLRKDFEGMEANLGYGNTTDTDASEQTASLVWGFGDDKSNGTLILDYFTNNALMGKDRDLGSANLSGKGLGFDNRSSRNFPGRFISPIRANPATTAAEENLTDPACTGGCVFDYGPFSTLLPSAERVGMTFLGRRDLTDHIELFTEVGVQHNTSNATGAPTPLDEDAGLTVPGTHPNNPWPGEDLIVRRYRVMDAGPRIWDIESESARVLAGLRGTVGDWDWETAVHKGRGETTQSGDKGWVRSDKLQTAINNGTFNPFGGARNPNVIGSILTNVTRQGESHMTSWDGKLSGILAETDAGEIGLAFGAEYREEDVSDVPDRQFTEGLIYGTEAVSASAERDQKAAYAELVLPVVKGLEFQLAARYDDYSDFGDTVNPKVGVRWQPIEDLTLRGSWGTGFRAPSLAQIGLGPSDESQFFTDRYRCAQTADPVDCGQLDYTIRFGGNAELDAEESESWNIGGIWQITNEFNLGIDVWNIRQDGKIDELPFQDIYTAECNNPTSTICERAPAAAGRLGRLIRINTTFDNLGFQEASGIDLTSGYNLDLGGSGALRFNLDWSYMSQFDRKVMPGQPIEELAGEYNQPKHRLIGGVDWVTGDWGMGLTVNYTGEFEDYFYARNANGGQRDLARKSPTVDAFTTVNAQVRFSGFENTQLSLGIENLFDEEVPFANGDGDGDLYGYASSVHNPRGQYVYGKVSYRF